MEPKIVTVLLSSFSDLQGVVNLFSPWKCLGEITTSYTYHGVLHLSFVTNRELPPELLSDLENFPHLIFDIDDDT
jgi:hypothetical protein